jgi:hypothetical protein
MPRKSASGVGGVCDKSFDGSGYQSRVFYEDGSEEKRSAEIAQDYGGRSVQYHGLAKEETLYSQTMTQLYRIPHHGIRRLRTPNSIIIISDVKSSIPVKTINVKPAGNTRPSTSRNNPGLFWLAEGEPPMTDSRKPPYLYGKKRQSSLRFSPSGLEDRCVSSFTHERRIPPHTAFRNKTSTRVWCLATALSTNASAVC